MAIPDFQTIMLPMLQSVADGQTRSMREVTQLLSQHFSLTEDEQHELLPSGQQSSFSNRVAWAKTHLKAAGLVDNSVRGMIKISESGLNLLATKPPEIKSRLLRNYPSYLEFVSKAEPGPSGDPARGPVEVISIDVQTPHEIMASVYQTLTKATIDELLSRLQSCSPPFFEMIVVRLLMAMGYGGVAGHGLTTGRSGDGGIDGVIKQDKLGLDVVCIQAKRWEGSVGRPTVQQFVGSMDYIRAKKGVIITTSLFTEDAKNFVDRIEGKKVVLMDGKHLASLMIEHNLGVITTKTFELKDVSNDFFDESDL